MRVEYTDKIVSDLKSMHNLDFFEEVKSILSEYNYDQLEFVRIDDITKEISN